MEKRNRRLPIATLCRNLRRLGDFAWATRLTKKCSLSCEIKSLHNSKAIRQAAEGLGPGGLHLELQSQRRAARTVGLERRKHVMAQSGTIKFFNADKGYGFIRPADGGKDIFVHITAVEQAGLASLNEGQKLSFEVEPDKKGKGPKAVNLHLE
jgi:cold shock protein